jgi:Sulfotransferase family
MGALNLDTSAIYFLHIPKTAGTSFMSLLHEQYPTEAICPAYLWRDLLRIPIAQRSTYRLYRGHFYAYLDQVVERPYQTITFVRDPIERSLSHYAHIYRDPAHYFHQRAHERGGLLAFLQDPLMNPLIHNFQTRALAMRVDPTAIMATLSQEAIDSLMLERILETLLPEGISDDELFARAKLQIDQCLFVGLSERFSDSIKMLARSLQWSIMPQSIWLNTSQERTSRYDLDAKTLAVLHAMTYLDAEIYSYAQRRFEAAMLG